MDKQRVYLESLPIRPSGDEASTFSAMFVHASHSGAPDAVTNAGVPSEDCLASQSKKMGTKGRRVATMMAGNVLVVPVAIASHKDVQSQSSHTV